MIHPHSVPSLFSFSCLFLLSVFLPFALDKVEIVSIFLSLCQHEDEDLAGFTPLASRLNTKLSLLYISTISPSLSALFSMFFIRGPFSAHVPQTFKVLALRASMSNYSIQVCLRQRKKKNNQCTCMSPWQFMIYSWFTF